MSAWGKGSSAKINQPLLHAHPQKWDKKKKSRRNGLGRGDLCCKSGFLNNIWGESFLFLPLLGRGRGLTFSTLFFHLSDRFIPVKLCFMLKLWRESGYVNAEKMQRDTLDPPTGLRRGESIQEMLKKVKVRSVLIVLPDMGASLEIHTEQSWTSILTFTDLQLF